MDRPTIHCLVSYPLNSDPELWTSPAVVSLEIAFELKDHGYYVVGPDPEDEEAMTRYEQMLRAMHNSSRWLR